MLLSLDNSIMHFVVYCVTFDIANRFQIQLLATTRFRFDHS